MKYSHKFFILGFSVLALNACSHPNAMPSGYTYHHDRFKSADPSPALGVVKTNQESVLSQTDIDRAVDDLLRKITARAGVSPKPVYIITPSMMTPFYSAVDDALRNTMRELGYALSDTQTGAYGFAYSGRNLSKPRGTDNDGYPNVELMLQIYDSVSDNARLLTQQAGNYFIEGAQDYSINLVDAKTSSNWKTTSHESLPSSESLPPSYSVTPVTDFDAPITRSERVNAITPTIEYGSLSKREVSDKAGDYSQKRSINAEPLTDRARVSKHIEY